MGGARRPARGPARREVAELKTARTLNQAAEQARDGRPDEVSRRPRTDYVARLVGLPIFDPQGDQVGKVRDVVVALRSEVSQPNSGQCQRYTPYEMRPR
mgnify:CR=1 FL=1